MNFVEKNYFNGTFAYIVEVKIEEEVFVYDVRIEIVKNVIQITDIGKRKKRAKQFNYLTSSLHNNYSYRKMHGDERKAYYLKKLVEYAPKELLNAALTECKNEIQIAYID